MDYVKLGNTGLKVSQLCLGCMTYGSKKWREWVLEENESRPFFKQALDSGINFFDTANVYSLGVSEEITGRALRDFARRDEVVIATKLFNKMRDEPNGKGLSRKAIFTEIDASLKRLGTDYVDLYQIHRWDYDTPIEETLEALHDVVRAGKARYIGASSMFAWQFAKALYTSDLHGWTRFVSMQNQLNLVYREEEREMLPLCRDQKIAVIPWSPLARGFLAGKWKKGEDGTTRSRTDDYGRSMYTRDSDYDIADRLTEIAKSLGLPNMQVALAWVLQKPGITSPIIGASKPGHLEDALGALNVKLDADTVRKLEELYEPHPILDHD